MPETPFVESFLPTLAMLLVLAWSSGLMGEALPSGLGGSSPFEGVELGSGLTSPAEEDTMVVIPTLE